MNIQQNIDAHSISLAEHRLNVDLSAHHQDIVHQTVVNNKNLMQVLNHHGGAPSDEIVAVNSPNLPPPPQPRAGAVRRAAAAITDRSRFRGPPEGQTPASSSTAAPMAIEDKPAAKAKAAATKPLAIKDKPTAERVQARQKAKERAEAIRDRKEKDGEMDTDQDGTAKVRKAKSEEPPAARKLHRKLPKKAPPPAEEAIVPARCGRSRTAS